MRYNLLDCSIVRHLVIFNFNILHHVMNPCFCSKSFYAFLKLFFLDKFPGKEFTGADGSYILFYFFTALETYHQITFWKDRAGLQLPQRHTIAPVFPPPASSGWDVVLFLLLLLIQ